MNKKIYKDGIEVVELQIKALKNLKKSLDKSFSDIVKEIIKCKSKILICGVGKSGKIASKIAATLSSVGTPTFAISANDCSHGDLGSISARDLLILISHSGNTIELKNIIHYAKMNKIKIIGVTSNKDSFLSKSSYLKIILPKVFESGFGIVPTSSTTTQLCLGDALSIATMKQKKFGKNEFKKFHPGGSLGNKLRTAADIMLTKNKIPFVNENETMKKALKILSVKNLGFLLIVNNKGLNIGIFTDGDLKRVMQNHSFIDNLKIKNFMTKRPYSVEKNTLATDALNLMNEKKITNLCVYSKDNKKKVVGVIHIHNIINSLV